MIHTGIMYVMDSPYEIRPEMKAFFFLCQACRTGISIQ